MRQCTKKQGDYAVFHAALSGLCLIFTNTQGCASLALGYRMAPPWG
jgi:hypothetical protein